VQVFDMRKLEAFGPRSRPAIFTADAVFTGVGSSHNIVNMADSNYLMVVGQKECSGSPYIVDIRDPLNPKKVGCQSNLDGYSHDAQVIRYSGPDSRYTGREIVISYNEDTLTIYDATVKDNLRVVSRTGYEGAQYTHQGWLVDGAQTHILMNDELDEIEGTTPEGGRTATLVWNISDLEKPVQEGIFSSPATSIGHNAYPKDGYSYASNYCSGLRVTDTRQVNSGGGAASMKEVAFFDVRPEDDSVEFFGAWSHFIFPSGWIAVNSIERGSFIVRVQPGVLASGGKKGGPKGPKGPK
jgi:choice-of-anchor B domain-containing protein